MNYKISRFVLILSALLLCCFLPSCTGTPTPDPVLEAFEDSRGRALASYELNVQLLETAPHSERRTQLLEAAQSSLKTYADETRAVGDWLRGDRDLPSASEQQAMLEQLLGTVQSLLRRGES